jgi:hypothetical protein
MRTQLLCSSQINFILILHPFTLTPVNCAHLKMKGPFKIVVLWTLFVECDSCSSDSFFPEFRRKLQSGVHIQHTVVWLSTKYSDKWHQTQHVFIFNIPCCVWRHLLLYLFKDEALRSMNVSLFMQYLSFSNTWNMTFKKSTGNILILDNEHRIVAITYEITIILVPLCLFRYLALFRLYYLKVNSWILRQNDSNTYSEYRS